MASSQAQGAQLESCLTTSVCQANRSDTLLDFDRDDNVLGGIPQSEQATYEQGTHGVCNENIGSVTMEAFTCSTVDKGGAYILHCR